MSGTRFDRDSAVVRSAPGEYGVRVDRGWWIIVGANGGYLAALALRAIQAELDDPERAPRSLTLHYVSPAREGDARIRVRVERSGRSLSTVSARFEQDNRLVLLALAACAHPRDERLEYQDRVMPEAPAPEQVAPKHSPTGHVPTLRERFDTRPVFDAAEPGKNAHAIAGGWLRLREPRVPDAAQLALMCDAWPPAVSQRRALGPGGLRGVPTIDLTVHFRAPLPASARPDDHYLCVFRSQTARGGFLEEDGEIWTRDGVLLAHSRQLAMLI